MRMGGFIILRILQKVSFRNILHEWFLCLINIGSQSTNFLFYCIEDTSKASSTFAHERYSLSTQAFGWVALCINCHKFPGPSIKIVKILFSWKMALEQHCVTIHKFLYWQGKKENCCSSHSAFCT